MRAPLPVKAAAAAASTAALQSRTVRVDETFYPSSDGKPMAENMWQAKAILNAAGDLEETHPQALVAEDILVYPEEGNRYNSVAPDVLVAFGIGTHKRMSYFVWAEGKPPDWVLEVASQSTNRRDLNYKRDCYAAMGVPEYWLFDAKGDVFPRGMPQLQGLKLVDGEYRPLEPAIAGGERTIHSEVLGLDVRAEGELLRFHDPATGRDVRHRAEVKADEERAQAHAEREAAARSAAEARAAEAEARVAELEAVLRRSRAE